MNKSLFKNALFSILAQIVALLVNFFLGFFLPKFIDEYQYAYWQMYVLYSGYVGIFQLGLLEGIVLRYAQYNYDELDKKVCRSQFLVLLSLSTLGSCLVACSSFILDGSYKKVAICIAIAVITKNIFCYCYYFLQFTNRIKQYAICIISQKAAYFLFICIFLLLKLNSFYYYCLADILGDVFAILIGSKFNKKAFFGSVCNRAIFFTETGRNIFAGGFILVASYASSLLVGGAKMVIQWRWDTLVFGKVAFAFSVSNLFLTFVTAISVVLFPSLKRMKEDELPALYGKIRNAISPLLFVAMLFYFPLSKILALWLPKYTVSLVYLGILLPIIIFSSKVSLLTNNYLKAYRKEKLMLVLNVASVALGMALFLLCAYGFNHLDLLLYSVVFAIMVRSIASEIVVSKLIHQKFYKEFALELFMTVGFIISVQFFSLWIGCAVYAAILVVYLVINRKSLALMLQTAKSLLHKKEKQP